MFKIQLFFFKIIFFIFRAGYPFGIQVWAKKNDYENIYEKSILKNYKNIDNYEKKFHRKLDNKWFNNLALTTQVVIKKSSINFQHGKILYYELQKYLEQNDNNFVNILETGTARGFSSICMSRALNDKDTKGKITTIDILPNDKRIYWNSISDLEGKKTRTELLNQWSDMLVNIDFIQGSSKKVLNNLNIDRVNFAFLDGAHNSNTVNFEFNWVKKRQKKNDVIIFDDYNTKDFLGIVELVKKIEIEKIYKVEKIFSEENRGYAIAYKL